MTVAEVAVSGNSPPLLQMEPRALEIRIGLTSRQGNNEEQAHTRNKGTNEHDWKEIAIFLKTSINT
jgi:hypothetical protein